MCRAVFIDTFDVFEFKPKRSLSSPSTDPIEGGPAWRWLPVSRKRPPETPVV